MSKEFKEFLQDEMNREADEIMREVENDPEIADLKAPPELKNKLMEQIREYEEKQAYQNLSPEDQELIRLGKVYKRKRRYRKYLVLAASLIMVMALGVTSVGGPKRMIEVVGQMMAGRKQVLVNTDSDKIELIETIDEEEAYQLIQDEFGFTPVRLYYLPDGMEFQKVEIYDEIQSAQLTYRKKEDRGIVLRMQLNYRTQSFGLDNEDEIVGTYVIENEKVCINVTKYFIKDEQENRWVAQFSYKDVQYFLLVADVGDIEFKKIVKNLEFF